MENRDDLKKLITVEGLMEAEIIKSRLENFEIPSMLKYESAGRLLGITMNGLGKVVIMVPPECYHQALEILDSEAAEEGEEAPEA